MRQRANEIIVNLISSNDFNNCIGKVKPSDLQDDLKAEVSLILLETEPEKIITLSEKKQLNFYTVRIIMNLAFSNTSPFYKKYRLPFTELKHDEPCDDSEYLLRRFEKENREEEALIEVGKMAACDVGTEEWVSGRALQIYMETGTFRSMQEATMIPYQTCHKMVNKGIEKVKQRI